MKRVLISVFVLVVLATLGLFIGKGLKKNTILDSHTSSEKNSDRIYHIVDRMPQQTNTVVIQYPKDALEAGIGGTVHVKMIINKEGIVDEAEVSVSSGVPSIDQAALDAAKQLKYTPALVNGEAVRMRLFKPFVFDPDNVEKRQSDER